MKHKIDIQIDNYDFREMLFKQMSPYYEFNNENLNTICEQNYLIQIGDLFDVFKKEFESYSQKKFTFILRLFRVLGDEDNIDYFYNSNKKFQEKVDSIKYKNINSIN